MTALAFLHFGFSSLDAEELVKHKLCFESPREGAILDAEDRTLTFEQFMAVILDLRGSNTATVKDIVDSYLNHGRFFVITVCPSQYFKHCLKLSVCAMRRAHRQPLNL